MGPRVKENYTIAHPGNPVQILENKKLRCRAFKTGATVEQDVGGWVAMPKDHWNVIAKKAGVPADPPKETDE